MHLRITSNCVVFKTRAVNEIQDRLSGGRAKIRAEPVASNILRPGRGGGIIEGDREGVASELRGKQEGVASWQASRKSLIGKRRQ